MDCLTLSKAFRTNKKRMQKLHENPPADLRVSVCCFYAAKNRKTIIHSKCVLQNGFQNAISIIIQP